MVPDPYLQRFYLISISISVSHIEPLVCTLASLYSYSFYHFNCFVMDGIKQYKLSIIIGIDSRSQTHDS